MAALTSILDELADLAKDLGVIGTERTREIGSSHTPTSASTLSVETKNGAIDVHPAEGDALVVDAIVKTRREDEDLDAVTLDLAEAGDTITLTVDVPEVNHATTVDLDVGVPDSLAIANVHTKNGKIDVRDVHGDARLDTTNGKITATSIDGTIAVHAKNGAITVRDTPIHRATSKNGTLDLDLPELVGPTIIETTNGTITIEVPTDLDADFTLAATTGRVTVEGLTCLVEESSQGYVTGALGIGGPHLDARTKHGTITLRAR